MPKHFARWILLFGLLLIAYYIYRAFMAITAPITGVESIANNLITAVKNGVFMLYDDARKIASSIVGGETGSVSDNPTPVSAQATLAPGVNTTPTTLLINAGIPVSPPPGGGFYFDPLNNNQLTYSPTNQNP